MIPIFCILFLSLSRKPLKFRNVTWPAINDDLSAGEDEYAISYMLMDNEDKPKMIPEPFGSRMKFWADIKDWI